MQIRDILARAPVIPVLTIERKSDAVPLARALCAGGLIVLEVTLRTSAALAAFAPVFPDVIFCPTGGITRESAPRFLALANVACVGGSWITPAVALKSGDWAQIEALARDAASLARRPR